MPTRTEIAVAAERVVARALEARGWDTNIDRRTAGSTDLEAREADGSRHLVFVRGDVAPDAPAGLTAAEEQAARHRAAWLGCRAWEAKVALDEGLRPLGAVEWRELAK